MCMKRTNLVLDEQLLDEVTRLSGERTYSGAVMRALDEYARRCRARRIFDLAGSGLWEGDLGEMRRDAYGTVHGAPAPMAPVKTPVKAPAKPRRARAAR